MGKGKRLKEQRRQPTPRAPLEVLKRAFDLVAQRFGTQSRCVEAAAMLQGIAKHLGYELQVRPVSLGINDRASGRSVGMGQKILGSLTEEQREAMNTDNVPDGMSLGHVVLTLSDPPYLMDPNLKQVNPMGINVPNIFAPIESAEVDPEEGSWILTGQDFEITYILDTRARPLLEGFDEFKAVEEGEYRKVATMLRQGGTIELMPQE